MSAFPCGERDASLTFGTEGDACCTLEAAAGGAQ
jgi:hypothetical protein